MHLCLQGRIAVHGRPDLNYLSCQEFVLHSPTRFLAV
jgi:hypothetical protein